MKNSGIFAAIAAIALFIASCHKKLPEPEKEYNSEIKISGIQFYNLPPFDSIIGHITFTIATPNDTIPGKIDTSVLTQKFFPLDLTVIPVTTQSYYYYLPENVKSVQFDLSVEIFTLRGPCDSMTINNFSFIKDNVSRISTALDFNFPELRYESAPLFYSFE